MTVNTLRPARGCAWCMSANAALEVMRGDLAAARRRHADLSQRLDELDRTRQNAAADISVFNLVTEQRNFAWRENDELRRQLAVLRGSANNGK